MVMRRAISIARTVRSLRIFSCVSGLEDLELYFDVDCDGHRLAEQGGRLEAVLLNCGQGTFVKGVAAGFNNVDVCRNAIGGDCESDEYKARFALVEQRAGVFGFNA